MARETFLPSVEPFFAKNWQSANQVQTTSQNVSLRAEELRQVEDQILESVAAA